MIFRWRGNGAGTKTAWNDGRNWVNESGSAYAQGVYPGVNNDGVDDVMLDAAVAAAANALAGYDASAKDIRSFRVSGEYNQDVGSAGTYLQIDADEIVIDSDSTATVYLYANTGGSTIVTADGAVYPKGTIDTLVCLKGSIELDAATTISTALTVGYVSSQTADVILTIPDLTSLPATIEAHGGTVDCSEPITSLNINGAEWTQTTGDITTTTLISGLLNWIDGDIGTARLYGGTLDASGGTNARTLGVAYVYPTSAMILDNGQDNIQVTSYIRNYGGTVTFPAGYDLAPYATETYAGASDAVAGIAPQTLQNTTLAGSAIYLGPYDKLDVFVQTGAIPASGALAFKLQEDDNSGFSSPADIGGKTASFDDGDDDQTKKITVWGYELTANTPYVRAFATESGNETCYLSATYVKSTY